MKLVTLKELKSGDTFRYQNSDEQDWHTVSAVDEDRLYYPGNIAQSNHRSDNVLVILKEESPEPEERIPGSIDIETTGPGDKVRIITKNGEPWNGYDTDKEMVKKYLDLKAEYTISKVDIHSWVTYVSLVEVPDRVFNSVSFYLSSRL